MSVLLALAVEALLVLVVLSIGSAISGPEGSEKGLVSIRFRAAPEQKQAQTTEEEQQPRKETIQRPAEQASRTPEREEPTPVQPQPRPQPPAPALIPLSPSQMTASDISRAPSPPSAPARSRMGPVDTRPGPADSARVSGSGPNGEPLYAAAWYREPYPDELNGYLSTATGPGWGLIACRTAPDYRVEDCVRVDEYPNGSNIARAVLAAAWQFRVRPPRVGGQYRVGEWVRIRIDYQMRQR